MRNLFIKIYQQILRIYVSTFKIKKTKIVHEAGCSVKVGQMLKEDGFSKVLVITDEVLMSLKLLRSMLEGFDEQGIGYIVYDGVVPNPTAGNVQEAKELYVKNGCEAIVAFGGGSVIDCAKMTGVVALSGKPVKRYDLMIPMIGRMAPLYAVPTTAGTGSEVTLSAVITDEENHKKMSITDTKLAPDAAFLDAQLLLGLPKHIVAATGIDALTHAIEAYVGNWKFKVTDEHAIKAVRRVVGNLKKAHSNEGDIEAHHEMLMGAAHGGYAFRTAGVGYVHAIAHRLSELYGVPHGLANAMVLPHMLRYSFEVIYKKLADLAVKAGVADISKNDRQIASAFVERVQEINDSLGIPREIEHIRKSDIELIARRAIAEANSTYPVPDIMSVKQIAGFIESLRPKVLPGQIEPADILEEKIKLTVKKQYDYFGRDRTLEYKDRRENLKRLKTAIKAYENEIMEALKADLGKSAFEAYATEVSIVYAEINHALKHLRKWMRPKGVATPLTAFGGVSKIYRQPRGVVLIMSPWNYPFQLTLAPLVAAVAAGNTAVIKPSSYSPHVSTVIEKLISDYFEPEYLCVFQGNRQINTILLQQRFDYIFFTGSVKVGKIVMQQAAKTLTPVTLELGGKSPCIVDKTADIKKTAKRIVWGKSVNSGQTCIAPDYLLVHESVKDELVAEMIRAKEKFFGKSTIECEDFGSIIRQQAFDSLVGLLHGHKTLYGGSYDERKLKIELTLLDNPALESPVMQQEIFGPILPVIPVGNMDEAIRIVHKYEKPLALYLFSKDKALERRIISDVHFGGGCINDTLMHIANSNMPFGGIGNSGMGSYHADKGFEAFTHNKSIVRQNFLFDVPIRYAPYKNKLGIIKKIVK